MSKTDSDLVTLTRSGCREAFGQLIERHQGGAIRVALGMVANRDVAEELVQEAMLQAYLSLDRLREEARFSGWLHGIVLNVCRSYLRNRKPDGVSWEGLEWEPWVAAPLAPDPALVAEQRERERHVLDAIHALSPENRDATLLFYYDQLSVREVAAALGISVTAVKGRLHQSRKQLKARLVSLQPEGAAPVPRRQRRRKMVKVSVVPMIPSKELASDQEAPSSERQAQHFLLRVIMSQSPHHAWEWVGLMEEGGDQFLPIQLGWDTRALAAVLEGSASDVSPALALMASLLKATSARPEAVRIGPLTDEILHGTIVLRQGSAEVEVAARPGDAIALAVQSQTPIFVAEKTMARASWDVSNPLAMVQRLLQVGDEAALRTAAEEPFIRRVGEAIIEHGLRYLHASDRCRDAEVVLEWNGGTEGRIWITMGYREGGNWYGRNVPLPAAVLPLLVARFKLMANLRIADQHVPQHGLTMIEQNGRTDELAVVTQPTEHGENLRLCLLWKDADQDDRFTR